MNPETPTLSFLQQRNTRPPRVVIVSPHPDDEVIGLGTRLPFLEDATVVQVTDGAPAEMSDAHARGYFTREAYAAGRQQELHEALSLAGTFRLIELQVPDQGSAWRLRELTRRVREVIAEVAPEYVVTVPFEGGHPDHDATAFAVHQAGAEMPGRFRILEMLSYHHRNGACEMERFLDETEDVLTIELNTEQAQFKRRLFECFATQQKVLQWFPLRFEKFRFAPRYDFTQPPHPGQLYYEKYQWGLNARRWCDLAKEALGISDLLAA